MELAGCLLSANMSQFGHLVGLPCPCISLDLVGLCSQPCCTELAAPEYHSNNGDGDLHTAAE